MRGIIKQYNNNINKKGMGEYGGILLMLNNDDLSRGRCGCGIAPPGIGPMVVAQPIMLVDANGVDETTRRQYYVDSAGQTGISRGDVDNKKKNCSAT